MTLREVSQHHRANKHAIFIGNLYVYIGKYKFTILQNLTWTIQMTTSKAVVISNVQNYSSVAIYEASTSIRYKSVRALTDRDFVQCGQSYLITAGEETNWPSKLTLTLTCISWRIIHKLRWPVRSQGESTRGCHLLVHKFVTRFLTLRWTELYILLIN